MTSNVNCDLLFFLLWVLGAIRHALRVLIPLILTANLISHHC